MSLGGTIRAWRDRLPPDAAGRAKRSGGRAPGLRREDLAELAGLSVDYVVRLEQGRATHPSAQVIAALARALQLTVEERDHLYRLADLRVPTPSVISEHITPAVQRILATLHDAPAGVFTADWRLVWWNVGWVSLLGDPTARPPEQRSLVSARFPVGADRTHAAAWPVTAEDPEQSDRAIVADLRRASGRYPKDRRLSDLIRRTLEGNTRFAQLWQEAAVATHAEDRKTILHPTVGAITLDCGVIVDADTDLKVVIYTARPGTEDESRLQLARTVSIPAGAQAG